MAHFAAFHLQFCMMSSLKGESPTSPCNGWFGLLPHRGHLHSSNLGTTSGMMEGVSYHSTVQACWASFRVAAHPWITSEASSGIAYIATRQGQGKHAQYGTFTNSVDSDKHRKGQMNCQFGEELAAAIECIQTSLPGFKSVLKKTRQLEVIVHSR